MDGKEEVPEEDAKVVLTAKVRCTTHTQDWLYVMSPTQTCDNLSPPSVEEGENKLQYSYSVWFTQRMRGGSVSSTPSDYEDNIKLVGSFSSVSSDMLKVLAKHVVFVTRWSSSGLTIAT